MARAYASTVLPQSLCNAWVGSPSPKFGDAQSPFHTMLVAQLLPRPNWGRGGTKHSSVPFWQGKAFAKPTAPLNYLLQLWIPAWRFSLSHHLPALAPAPTGVLRAADLQAAGGVQLVPLPLTGSAALPVPSQELGGDRQGLVTPPLTENLKNCRNIKAISVTQDEAFVLFNWADLSAWAAGVLLT